jgi:hypothetical protein
MKTTRTRMLIVFTAAAVIISLFMHWKDLSEGFRDGWNSGGIHSTTR